MCLERACHTAACEHECVCVYRVQESISWGWGSVGGLGVDGVGRVVRLQAAVGMCVFAGAQHHLLGLPRLYHFIRSVLDRLHWSRMAVVPLILSLSLSLPVGGCVVGGVPRLFLQDTSRMCAEHCSRVETRFDCSRPAMPFRPAPWPQRDSPFLTRASALHSAPWQSGGRLSSGGDRHSTRDMVSATKLQTRSQQHTLGWDTVIFAATAKSTTAQCTDCSC